MVRQSNKSLYAIIAVVALVLLAIVGVSNFKGQQRIRQAQLEQAQRRQTERDLVDHNPAFGALMRRDPAIRAETEDHLIIVQAVARTAAECDRLHITNPERKRRVDATFHSGMAELARVRAQHYTVPFDAAKLQ